MNTRTYCCELMARWVSNPLGANAPPEPKLTVEHDDDLPGIKPKPHLTCLNTPLDDNSDVLIHHDLFDDYGIVGRGNWGSHYVGIAFCPWCGSDLGTDDRAVGKMMSEYAGQFADFDSREQSVERYREERLSPAWLISQGFPYTEAMSDIEVLIRIQGKYRDDLWTRYSDYPGRAEFDFDKEWPPKELAVIAQFCVENGKRDPDLALWKLLCAAEQPAVWALALLDLAADDIPHLRNIYFERRPDDEPCIVIETEPLRSARELIEIGERIGNLMSQIKGYDITAGEPSSFKADLDDDIQAYAKLTMVSGYLSDASNIEEGILRFLVAPYFRDDVHRFLQEKATG